MDVGEFGRLAASIDARALVRRITASAVSSCSFTQVSMAVLRRVGVLGEQVQDPGVPAGTAEEGYCRPRLSQAEVGEAGRQDPVAEDRGVVERSGLRSSVARKWSGSRTIFDFSGDRPAGSTTWPARRSRRDRFEPFDRHQPKREGSGDAVAIAVEGHGLVLVHRDGGMDRAGLEPIPRQGQRRGRVLGRSILDRERAGERPHDRSRSEWHQRRSKAFKSSRSLTRGTGVANRFWTPLTVLSASGFSLPRAGMQNFGSKT